MFVQYAPYDVAVTRLSIVIIVSIMGICTLGCYRFGRAHLQNLAPRTRSLYRQFITALCIELGAAFAVNIVWLSVVHWQRERHVNVGFYLIWRANFLYPTLTMSLNLGYITCYRRAVLQLFGLDSTPKRAVLAIDLTSGRTETKVFSSAAKLTFSA